MSTYYDILRVAEDADDREIKAAYRQAALAYHPDHIPKGVSKRMREDAAQTWLEIQEAFAVLSDPAKRQEYDTLLDEMRQSEEFEQQFEPPSPPPSPPKPKPAPPPTPQQTTPQSVPQPQSTPQSQKPSKVKALWLWLCFGAGRHWRWLCWILTALLFVRNGVRNSDTWAITAGGVAVVSAVVAFLIVISSGSAWTIKGRYIINATTVVALVITVIIITADSIPTAQYAKTTTSNSQTSIPTTPKNDDQKLAMNQIKGQGQFQFMDYPHGYLVNELCAGPTNAGNESLCYPSSWKPWLKELQLRVAGDEAKAITADSGVQTPGNLVVSWDGRPRVVFGGCRPHFCTEGRVYFLVDTTADELDIIWRNERGVKYLGPNSAFLRAASAYELLEAKQSR